MRDRSSQADGNARHQQCPQVRRKSREKSGDGDAGKETHHEPAALDNIAQRHKGEDANRVTDLRRHSDHAHLAVAGAQAAGHIEQQRLVVIDVGDSDTARKAEKWQQAAMPGMQVDGSFRGNGRDDFQIPV